MPGPAAQRSANCDELRGRFTRPEAPGPAFSRKVSHNPMKIQ